MTKQPYAEVARRAANQLQSLDDKLPGFVELALQGNEPPKTYSLAITIALASLAGECGEIRLRCLQRSEVETAGGQSPGTDRSCRQAEGGCFGKRNPAQHDRVIATVVAEILRG